MEHGAQRLAVRSVRQFDVLATQMATEGRSVVELGF